MSPALQRDLYRIFLVEDSPAEVRLIQEAVKEAGLIELIEFEYAYDGEEACELLDTWCC
jgi:CheY-like chemotaxis protein